MASALFISPSPFPCKRSHFSVSCSSNANSPSNPVENVPVKVPTAPWMRGPLLVPPHEVLDLSKPKRKTSSGDSKLHKSDKALVDKVSGVRGGKVMQKLVQSIEKLRERSESSGELGQESEERELRFLLRPSAEEEGGARSALGGKVPWVRDEKAVFRRTKRDKVVNEAELRIEEELLDRLRREAVRLRKWVKVKKIGISQDVVDEIKRTWSRNELAMVKFDIPLCRNMDRAQEILEMKTGGLVIWRKKDAIVIFRGINYTHKRSSEMDGFLDDGQPKLSSIYRESYCGDITSVTPSVGKEHVIDAKMKEEARQNQGSAISTDCMTSSEPINLSLYERETDRLLNGLGPRFVDWWMRKPLPVDGDLLPEKVPGFCPPRRFCPSGIRSKLTDDELTYLRKIAHTLPTHFVLGRNRKLQGLAAAILKLWEKSLIVKIAVKWGVPNTDNEQMAYELKHSTGGVLLLRNKFYIILFRGKDFLSPGLASTITEREMELTRCQLSEENARVRAFESLAVVSESLAQTSGIGTLSEFQEIQTEFKNEKMGATEVNIQEKIEIERLKEEIRKRQRRLFILNSKINKSARQLSMLNSARRPLKEDADKEMLSEEEIECFQKLGLKMDKTVVLGRRGVFDGVIEALHQHWKHRELVKVITMQRTYQQVISTAKLLETESGGILVSVVAQKEGHAIILYRGKNYKRPLKLSTDHLLTKRKALQKSLEMQRLGSLKFFANRTWRTISDLQQKMAELKDKLGQNEKEFVKAFDKL